MLNSVKTIAILSKTEFDFPEMNMVETTDQQLIDRTLKGELTAFDQLVTKYQTMISRSLYRFCPHRSDLEDLVQDTFFKAFRNLAKRKPEAPFEYWLKRIAYNTGHDYFRKSKRTPVLSSSVDLDDYIETQETSHQQQSTEIVQLLLSHLKPDDRMLLTLQYLEEQTLQDIADTTGWSLSKTKVKSFRAKKQLRKLLKHYKIDEV